MTAGQGRNGPAVIVMARAPRRGEGKTRLRRVLSDEACTRLQEAFLRDAVEVALAARLGPVCLFYTPPDAASWAEGTFADQAHCFPQQGDGLGARLLAALRRVQTQGFGPLLVIGSDTPLLQPRHLREALRALGRANLCLGPSADGGYYLLACRAVPPQVFNGVPWGTDRVLVSTLRIAAESALRYALIEELYDVDSPADLSRLRQDLLRTSKRPGFRGPRYTARALGL